jgi:hypothetical protein
MVAPAHGAVLRQSVFNIGDGRHLLGTGFAVRVLDSARPGTFLLTAAHAVRYARHANGKLTLANGGGDQITGSVLACNEEAYPDVALVYFPSKIIAPLAASAATTAGPVVVRGGLSGVLTEQATLGGWCYGQEYDQSRRYLDIVLSDLAIIEPDGAQRAAELNDVYAALRGLSGAPVVRADEAAAPTVIGLIAKRNTHGIANRVYAIPMQDAADYLQRQGFYLDVALAPPSDLALGALAGVLITRILESSEGMHELWEDISGLFYRGMPVDQIIRDAIRRPASYGLDGGLAIHELEYLLARLLLKRGRETEASRLFVLAGQGAALGHSSAHRRLSALVRLREVGPASLTDHQGPHRQTFGEAIRSYENLVDFSEHERAYEIASAVGAAAADFSLTEQFLARDEEAIRVFTAMAERHTELVSAYPRWLLPKQEPVGIMLQLTGLLWTTGDVAAGREHAERILANATRGASAARQRSNGIFYIQMMLARAVAARAVADHGTAFYLLGLAADALAKGGLTLNHEGLKILHAYLQRSDPELARLLGFMSVNGVTGSDGFFANNNGVDSRAEMADALHALRQAAVAAEQIASVADLLHLAP